MKDKDGKVEMTKEEYNANKKLLLETESRTFPGEKYAIVIACFLFTMVTSLSLGTKSFPSILNIEMCTSPYFLISGLYILGMLVIAYMSIRILKKEFELKKSLNWPFGLTDNWNNDKILQCNAFCFILGIISSVVGIGGGLLLVPYLTVLGKLLFF